jgi:hypothetical protein
MRTPTTGELIGQRAEADAQAADATERLLTMQPKDTRFDATLLERALALGRRKVLEAQIDLRLSAARRGVSLGRTA